MTFETLNYILVIAKEKNLTVAAEKLFSSPQYLSKYLKNIETEYGITIFTRYPSLRLTPEGRLFIKRIDQIRNIQTLLNTELENMKKNTSASLSFGTTSERANIILPQILPDYLLRFPNVKVVQKDVNNVQMQDMIVRQELDLGIALSLPNSDVLEKVFLAEEPVYLAISNGTMEDYFTENHIEKKQKFHQHTTLQEFDGIPFILGKSTWKSNPAIKEYAYNNNVNILFSIEVSSKSTELALVSKGCGICTCPHYMINHVNVLNNAATSPREIINLFPLQNDIQINNEWYLCYLKERELLPYMTCFINLLKTRIEAMFNQTPCIK